MASKIYRILLFFQGAFMFSLYLATIVGKEIPLNTLFIIGITSPALFFASAYQKETQSEESTFLIILGFIFAVMGIIFLVLKIFD